jgi:flagellin-like hook-associated protein FlgL
MSSTITNLSPQSAFFLANLNVVENNISQASDQVSSGLKITVASDAPDEIGTLLQLRANLAQNTQIQSNLTMAQTEANAADTALQSSIQLMESAMSLATEGASSISDATTDASLAQQVQAIQQEMVANSQATVQGRFIFSGDDDSGPEYQWGPTASNPVVSLIPAGTTPQSTRVIQNPAGGSFAASLTAQQIFDDQDPTTGGPASDNVFNALNTLQQALADNDTAGVTNSITLLQAASVHLNTMDAFYGNVQDQVQNANNYASNYAVQLQTQISDAQDADVTSAAMELTQGNTELQAAMQMEGQMPHTSLFNYLG